MKIGFAQQCITPALPVPLAGFGKKRTAESVLDDLYVKAVVYQRETEWYGILAYDLIGVDHEIIRRMKDGMEEMALKQENFLFAATHTHSGPGGVLDTGSELLKPAAHIFVETDPAVLDAIAKKSLLALRKAVRLCRETTVSCAKGTLEQIGDNRNCRDFPGNNEIMAAFLTQENGRSAVLWHFACHPTVMNSENEQISADFPGEAAARMEKRGYDMCLFLNGSCGDISTRFSRKGNGKGELVRYGQMIEEKLLELEQSAKQIKLFDFAVTHRSCRLKLKQAECIEQAQKKLDESRKRVNEAKQKGIKGAKLRLLQSYQEGAESNLALAKQPYKASVFDVPVVLIQINRRTFACVPGELFSELSNSLQKDRTHFVGYANGYLGYFADTAAYENFYYEALSSPFQKGQGERLMQFLAQALK